MKNLECFYVLGQNVEGGVDLASSYRVCEWMSYKESKNFLYMQKVPIDLDGICSYFAKRLRINTKYLKYGWFVVSNMGNIGKIRKKDDWLLETHSFTDFTFHAAAICFRFYALLDRLNVLEWSCTCAHSKCIRPPWPCLGLAWPHTVVPKR